MLNLRQFDLWAWATYTDTQKVAMLLGVIPLKIDRQHPFPPPFPLAPFPPHLTTSIVKYVRAHLTDTRCSSVTYVTQDGIWTAFSHPLPLFHMDSGNAPYVSHATSFPSQLLSTFAFLPPSSISTLIKMLPKKMTPYHYSALPGYPLPHKKKSQTTNILPNTPTCILVPHPHARLFMTGLSLRPKFST